MSLVFPTLGWGFLRTLMREACSGDNFQDEAETHDKTNEDPILKSWNL